MDTVASTLFLWSGKLSLPGFWQQKFFAAWAIWVFKKIGNSFLTHAANVSPPTRESYHCHRRCSSEFFPRLRHVMPRLFMHQYCRHYSTLENQSLPSLASRGCCGLLSTATSSVPDLISKILVVSVLSEPQRYCEKTVNFNGKHSFARCSSSE